MRSRLQCWRFPWLPFYTHSPHCQHHLATIFVSILILNLPTLTVMMISLFQRESSTTSPRLRRQLSWGRWRLWTTIARSWPSRSWRRTSTITHTMTASKQARNCARWFSRLWLESSDQPSSSSDLSSSLSPLGIVGWWPVRENKLLTFHYSGIRANFPKKMKKIIYFF